jgi:hypothetical protein
MIEPTHRLQFAEYRGTWPDAEREHLERTLDDLEQDATTSPMEDLPPWVCLRVRIPSWGLMYLAMRWNSKRLVRAKSLRGLLHALRALTPADFVRETAAETFDPSDWALPLAEPEHSRAA